MTAAGEPGPARRLRVRAGTRIAVRLSPEGTRRPTWFERLTVCRLSWTAIVRLNLYLEVIGQAATALWIGFLVSVPLGIDWREVVHDALNSGRRISGAVILVIALPTFAFLAARSVLGFARWRLQRELWRRDVQRLAPGPRSPAGPG